MPVKEVCIDDVGQLIGSDFIVAFPSPGANRCLAQDRPPVGHSDAARRSSWMGLGVLWWGCWGGEEEGEGGGGAAGEAESSAVGFGEAAGQW